MSLRLPGRLSPAAMMRRLRARMVVWTLPLRLRRSLLEHVAVIQLRPLRVHPCDMSRALVNVCVIRLCVRGFL
jgi:hypothetical protein